MNIPGNWGLDHLKGKLGGLLNDPQQMMALTQNPMFGAGMGLLAENSQPGGGNPAAGLLGGIMGAKQQSQEEADRQRIAELRQQLAELLRQQQQQGGAGGPQMSPVPNPPSGRLIP